jgi:hypothetical protein
MRSAVGLRRRFPATAWAGDAGLAQHHGLLAAQDRAGLVRDQEQAAVALGVDVQRAEADKLADQAAPVCGTVVGAAAERR